MTHVFLSPHLDDASLSCGGTIYQLTQKGERVIILTVTAGDPPKQLPESSILADLYARWESGEAPMSKRRLEDVESAKVLGAIAEHEAFLDCIYRQYEGALLYPSEESLFNQVSDNDLLIQLLDKQVSTFTERFTDTQTLYIPLGVGHHVDHQLVRDWGLKIYKHHPDLCVKFYEEYPYTRDTSAIERARTDLPSTIKIEAELVTLSGFDVTAKIQAVACYKSQISTFWDNVDAMASEIRDMFRSDEDSDTYVECFWVIQNQ